jgi:2-hydroxyacyl-CoA lyase 1
MQGYQILADSLAKNKIMHCYGIVGIYALILGIPVIELGFAIQAFGINYYGFRN